MRQLKLNRIDFKNSRPYGGELMKKAKNRGARPIATKKSMHLVLRSTQAQGEWSFRTRKNAAVVEQTLHRLTKKYGIRIYGIANSGNHLHIIFKLGNRFVYRAFIRSLTGTIALKITGSSKLKALKTRFWDRRPFTRVIEWGKAFRVAKDYLMLNDLEALGIIPYQKERLRHVQLRPLPG